jgi:cytochrome c oxidase cbb3-type subunit 3
MFRSRVLSLAVLAAAISCARRDAAAPNAAVPLPSLDGRIFAGGIAPAGIAPRTNPLAGNAAAARDGSRLFTAMNCDGCHGGGGSGWVGPSLADGRWRYGGSDADIFRSVWYGRPKGMPAYGGVLPPDAVWKLVAYLNSLSPPSDLPTESW